MRSKTFKKAGLFRGIGDAFSTVSSILGQGNLGSNVERGSDILSRRCQGMSPEWHKEHDTTFELAQNEAKEHFHRCPKCTKWFCENDWNEQEGLCIECAPRVNIEVAAARAKKMMDDIREKASSTQVFSGNIQSKQTLCPQCGKPAGEGKFCNNCGTTLGLLKCSKCGAESQVGTRFCGECGARL